MKVINMVFGVYLIVLISVLLLHGAEGVFESEMSNMKDEITLLKSEMILLKKKVGQCE